MLKDGCLNRMKCLYMPWTSKWAINSSGDDVGWSHLDLCWLGISGDLNLSYSGCLYRLRSRSHIDLCDLRGVVCDGNCSCLAWPVQIQDLDFSLAGFLWSSVLWAPILWDFMWLMPPLLPQLFDK